jgi:hypothetical protein
VDGRAIGEVGSAPMASDADVTWRLTGSLRSGLGCFGGLAH